MFVKKIDLVNYRNLEKQTAEFIDKTNIVYGKNAQGKTNLLEAVYLFSSGKSYRTSNDKELILIGKEFSKVSIEFESGGRDNTCEISFKDGKRKLIKLNGIPLKTTSELLGVFKSVIFSPEELELVSGSPETRRKFLNMSISSQRPMYYDILKDYTKILKQKNNLLKKICFDKSLEKTLFVWNEELAKLGAGIMLYRKEFIEKLIPEAKKAHFEISHGSEELDIKYVPNVFCKDFENKKSIEESILKNLQRKEETEKACGLSLVGPHRDDIEFLISGKPARSYASQGQQRTAVIALKIAQTERIKDTFGEYPVFLLDDILSELDSQRRRYLTDKIQNMQVIISCTEIESYKTEGEKRFFNVDKGVVTRSE